MTNKTTPPPAATGEKGPLKNNDIISVPKGDENVNSKKPPPPIKYINMADIEIEEIQWLWHPYIPYGKLTLMQGNGGCGKTFVILAIASALTRGDLLPEHDISQTPSNVIFQTAEDGLEDTIKSRLVQLGADCSKIWVIDDRERKLSLIDERLEVAIKEHNAKLLVLDPLQSYLGAGVDMYRANEVRPVLERLTYLAQRTGCAIVLMGHLNKSDTKAEYKGLGSVDIISACRSVLTFGKVQNDENEDLKAFAHTKSNLAYHGISIAYELSLQKGFKWIGAYDIEASELLSNPREQRPFLAIDKAKEFLINNLTGKVLTTNELYKKAEMIGISERTLHRAKKDAGVCTFQREKKWHWSIEA